MWDSIIGWLLTIGTEYGVDPLVFAVIYVVGIPLFTLSLAWVVRNVRAKKSLILPICSTTVCLISTYLYLLIAGRNLPLWVYSIILLLLLAAVGSTWVAVRRQMLQATSPQARG